MAGGGFPPERSQELIYLMNDMAWLQFLGGVTLYLAMPFAVAVTAFCDKSANPVFPRWSGFVNIWLVVILIPDQLLFFFHTGPFAWNGLFGLWLPVAGFSGFWLVNFYLPAQSHPARTCKPDLSRIELTSQSSAQTLRIDD